MKKIFKSFFFIILTFVILVTVYGVYQYQSDFYVKALIDNDESKLFYRPDTKVQNMADLSFTENTIKVEDAIEIHTYLFKPKTTPKANIFLIRGNSGNTSTSQDLIKPLVNNGFSVYTTDWRGFGKSTGSPNYKGILKDTETAFIDFLKQTENDSIKTIVYGMSLGGQLAVKLTKDNPAKVDALVLDGSLASAYSFIVDNFQEIMLQPFIKNAEAYNQEYIAIRDIAAIKNTPKLIIHSTKDRAVPFSRGENIFDAAKQPKTFWKTDTAHIKTLIDVPEEAIAKITALIQ